MYRLHEFDEQVKAVRDGMSRVVPVPLLSLFSAYELETMVCGSPDIPLSLLKSVATYKGTPDTKYHVLTWTSSLEIKIQFKVFIKLLAILLQVSTAVRRLSNGSGRLWKSLAIKNDLYSFDSYGVGRDYLEQLQIFAAEISYYKFLINTIRQTISFQRATRVSFC